MSAGGYGLPDLGSANFGTNRVSAGKLAFAWDDSTLAGVSLADGSAIFTATLRGLAGPCEKTSSLTFSDDPTVREVTVALRQVGLAEVPGSVLVTCRPGLALRMTNGVPVLVIQGTPGMQVELQKALVLAPGAWSKVADVTLSAPEQPWADPAGLGGGSAFYRLLVK